MPPPQIPVSPSSPVIPPVANFPFVDARGRLTPTAFQFLQQVWAAIQGSGAILDTVALDVSGQVGSEIDTLREDIANFGADAALLRSEIDAQIAAAVDSVMAWIPPSAALASTSTTTARGVLPLVNGDLPGPSLMADGFGQCIGVPI